MKSDRVLLQYGDVPNTHIVISLNRDPLFLVTYRDERTELEWPVSSLVLGVDALETLRQVDTALQQTPPDIVKARKLARALLGKLGE